MSRINTNIPALTAIHRSQANNADLETHLVRLATGLRINRGRDDPAGLIVSELLRSEMRSIEQGISNSTRANHLMYTVEGAMNEISSLLLELQELIVESANEAGLSESEVAANQLAIDSILGSIDRIAETTEFAGQKLLDGSKAYILSSVTPSELASVSIYAAHIPSSGVRDVTVRVTQSAETAQVALVGTTAGGVSQTSATAVELRGPLGSQLLSFADGTSLAQIRTAINGIKEMTGVSAIVSTVAVGGAASAVLLNSTGYGSDAFVSVEPISGNFIESANAGMIVRDTGVDVGVLINGRTANAKGLRADVRSTHFDTRVYLTAAFAQTNSTSTFSITGGGAIFQLAPEVNPNGQIFVGLDRVSTTYLGNSVVGQLYTLRSGYQNSLAGQNFATAQAIVEEAINEISSYRGRLGSIQKDHLEANIDALQITLENITASESNVRDADMAVEVSALTRAQILVESTQATLRIANSVPRMVLTLLG